MRPSAALVIGGLSNSFNYLSTSRHNIENIALPPTPQNSNRNSNEWITPRELGLFAFFFCFITLLFYNHFKFGLNVPPAVSGDEASYDAIGWSLSQNAGYRLNTIDPEFREPYDKAATENPELFDLGEGTDHLDRVRPPGLPFAMSLGDRLFGRQFWSTRLLNILAMASICGVTVGYLVSRLGMLPALLSLPIFILLDTNTRLYSRSILTEALAALLVALLALCLIHWQRSQRSKSLLLGGVLLGIVWLVRSAFLTWLPVLLLAILCETRRTEKHSRWRRGLLNGLLFGALFGLVAFPWIARNLRVNEGQHPFGIQGSLELSAGYSDLAWENRGVWVNLRANGFFDALQDDELTFLEQERLDAEYSKTQAITWITQNPLKTLALVPLKIAQSVRPHNVTEAILLTLTLLGIGVFPLRDERRVFLWLIAACLFGIGITWSVEGRFLVPLLFVQHLFAATGLWWIACKVFKLDAARLLSRSHRPEFDVPVDP